MNSRRDPIIDNQAKDHLSVVPPLSENLVENEAVPAAMPMSRKVEVVALKVPFRQLFWFSIKLAIALVPLLVILAGAWALLDGAMPLLQEAVFGPELTQE